MANHHTAITLLISSLLMAVTISGADARPTVRPNKMAALRRDTHGRGYMVDAAAPPEPEQEPTCDKCEKPEPKPKPEPEAKPELTCNKVHGVKAGETCCSVREGAGLTEDQFLGFNPNLCCEKLFVSPALKPHPVVMIDFNLRCPLDPASASRQC